MTDRTYNTQRRAQHIAHGASYAALVNRSIFQSERYIDPEVTEIKRILAGHSQRLAAADALTERLLRGLPY